MADDFEDAMARIQAMEQALERGLPDPVLLEAGHLGLNIVLLRTKVGLDVDGALFKPYTPEYAKRRAARGLSAAPDLAVTGQMLGGFVPAVTGKNEVTVSPLSEQEAIKDAAHNYGVDKIVPVRPHSRSTYVDSKTGRRVTRDEARKDQRRKNKRVTSRTENVSTHQRHQFTTKREHMDIRQPRELEAIGEVLGNGLAAAISKPGK